MTSNCWIAQKDKQLKEVPLAQEFYRGPRKGDPRIVSGEYRCDLRERACAFISELWEPGKMGDEAAVSGRTHYRALQCDLRSSLMSSAKHDGSEKYKYYLYVCLSQETWQGVVGRVSRR